MDDPGLTVAEALRILDPPIPRRTLERRLRVNCTPLDAKRKPPGRGRPADVYLTSDIYQQHAEWAVSPIGKRRPKEPAHAQG